MFQELAFASHFEETPAINNVDLVLNCPRLRFATGNDSDHTADINLQDAFTIHVIEWYDVIPISYIRLVYHTMKSAYGISSFIFQLTWPLHPFYVNRFNQVRRKNRF